MGKRHSVPRIVVQNNKQVEASNLHSYGVSAIFSLMLCCIIAPTRPSRMVAHSVNVSLATKIIRESGSIGFTESKGICGGNKDVCYRQHLDLS
jgi:hypothetical protein